MALLDGDYNGTGTSVDVATVGSLSLVDVIGTSLFGYDYVGQWEATQDTLYSHSSSCVSVHRILPTGRQEQYISRLYSHYSCLVSE